MSHGRRDVKRTDGRQITKEGWLMKEGGAARTKWQNRWFRLQGKTINYFTNREDASPQGTIHLDEVKDVSKIGEHSGKPHCLVMVTTKDRKKKVYYLSAESDEIINDWFVAFHANLAPDVPIKLVKYSTVEVFLSQGIRITGDVSYDILSFISHRVPVEKKRRDNFGWYCDRPIAIGTVLNLFADYGWFPERIYRSTALSGIDPNVVQPVVRIIFSKSPQGGPLDSSSRAKHGIRSGSMVSSSPSSSSSSSPNMSSKSAESSGSGKLIGALLGAAGRLSGLSNKGAGTDEQNSPAPPPPAFPPEATLLEGADDELISLMQEFDIPLSLLEISSE